jgi:hypothetical protein
MIFGYLDPVTGSALLQVGLAALAAVGLGWQYVRKFAKTLGARLQGESAIEPAPAGEAIVETNTTSTHG